MVENEVKLKVHFLTENSVFTSSYTIYFHVSGMRMIAEVSPISLHPYSLDNISRDLPLWGGVKDIMYQIDSGYQAPERKNH